MVLNIMCDLDLNLTQLSTGVNFILFIISKKKKSSEQTFSIIKHYPHMTPVMCRLVILVPDYKMNYWKEFN